MKGRNVADLVTTLKSPAGEIMSLPGRVPFQEIREAARVQLQQEIRNAERHLEEIENWSTTTTRGSRRALSFEEMLT